MIDELERGEVPLYTAKNLLGAIYDPIIEFWNEEGRRNLGQGSYITGLANPINTFHAQYTVQAGLTLALGEFLKGSGGRLFTETADRMTRKLIEMTWVTDPGKIQYLIPLVAYAQQTDAAIATLNYDNTLEFSTQFIGALCDTGFESWSQTGDFTFQGGHIPLIKLHGSIDWALIETKPAAEKPLKYETIKKVDPTVQPNQDFRPAIVFGGKNKLTAKGPFLSLLRAFETRLNQCNRLIVLGYSFRDEHVNEYIRTWINGDTSRVLTIINPGIAQLSVPFVEELRDIPNKDRVVLITKKTSDGLLDVI